MPNMIDELSAVDEEESAHDSDEKSHMTSESPTGHTSKGGSISEEQEIKNRVIKEEETDVRRARILVGTAFLACAVAVSVAVNLFAKNSNQQSFEIEYEGYVKDILALVRWEVRYNFALMEQLSASVTIATHLIGSVFPYHTEPDFEITGGFVDGMGGIMSAAFAPLVKAEDREQWEQYSVENQDWIERSKYLKAVHPVHRDALHGTIQDHEHDRRLQEEVVESISGRIFRYNEDGAKVPETSEPGKMFAPIWQVSPADYSAVNANLFSDPRFEDLYYAMIKGNQAVLSANTEIDVMFDFLFDPEEKDQKNSPHAFILLPVYRHFMEDAEVVGFLVGVTVFSNLLDRLLPEGRDGIIGVLDDTCGNVMSFELSGGKAKFLGYEDLHELEFDEYERYEPNIEMYEESMKDDLCVHDLRMYPSSKLRETFSNNTPAIYTSVVVMAFFVTAILLVVYDLMVKRRQTKTIKAAARTQAIVTSLFPKEIGKILIQEAIDDPTDSKENAWKKKNRDGETGLQSMIAGDGAASKPLADLFPEATIMFGDLVGFTAWSSSREPTQVFMLLEGLYSAFDEVATRRKVFKVETIGDCYVAVCGLPEPRKNHATTMVRFARECLTQMDRVFHHLTVELGPDTTDLGMRIGLHSGPVTAGVLRGDRARFQLFGDTVNTTARLESTGKKNRIHVSQETADIIIAAGKTSWVTPRQEKVHAKGLGEIQSYWVYTKDDTAKSAVTSTNSASSEGEENVQEAIGQLTSKDQRVLEWTAGVLLSLLKDIVARRKSTGVHSHSAKAIKAAEQEILQSTGMPLDEVKEFVSVARYSKTKEDIDPADVIINPDAISQLKDYIARISDLYNNDNPFHNFEHASHVTLSVVKLLKRIVTSSKQQNDNERIMDDRTYGITSDPLTQFSIAVSALIHDVDHSGVPNAQLITEEAQVASIYKDKSIAEQNSVDIAWNLLMDDSFQALRRTIYSTTAELKRFRQMVVHTVMATDIMDKDLSLQRKERWNSTFAKNVDDSSGILPRKNSDIDRKAIIVIEHIIQASDVAHTMQHWHVYQKWNHRLFKELNKAHKEGRGNDPSDNWYKGEIGFFDFYLIPLAQKLKSCGVFGVSGDEYLNYALQNRSEWASKGQAVVEQLVRETST